MAFYTYTKIAGLSSVLITLRKLCQLVTKYQSNIRTIIPTDKQAEYDDAMAAILAVCAIIELAARTLITPA